MTSRLYHPEDYPLANEWWRARHGQLSDLPAGMLPPLGVAVEEAGKPLCFLWAYESYGVGVCFIEWPVSDPGNGMEISRRAFQQAVTAIIALAGKRCIPPGEYKAFRAMPSLSLFRAMRDMGFNREYPDEHVPVILFTGGEE